MGAALHTALNLKPGRRVTGFSGFADMLGNVERIFANWDLIPGHPNAHLESFWRVDSIEVVAREASKQMDT